MMLTHHSSKSGSNSRPNSMLNTMPSKDTQQVQREVLRLPTVQPLPLRPVNQRRLRLHQHDVLEFVLDHLSLPTHQFLRCI